MYGSSWTGLTQISVSAVQPTPLRQLDKFPNLWHFYARKNIQRKLKSSQVYMNVLILFFTIMFILSWTKRTRILFEQFFSSFKKIFIMIESLRIERTWFDLRTSKSCNKCTRCDLNSKRWHHDTSSISRKHYVFLVYVMENHMRI